MTNRALTRAAAAAATVLVFGLGWILLAPPALGGKTRLVVTSGTSMEPEIHRGDLAVVRAGGQPRVGDVILYASHELHRSVLHRIIALDGSRFVMKGDNNGFRDAEHPTPGQVQGRLWFVVPHAGTVLAFVRRPANLALVSFTLVFLSFAGGRTARRRGTGTQPQPMRVETGPGPRRTADGLGAVARPAIIPAGVGLALFALVAVLAWSAPQERGVTQPGGYAHTGTFAYSAAIKPSAVYPGGRITTGDPAFVQLVHRLAVSFDYRFDSLHRNDVRGGIGLDARISDGSGWNRVIPVAPTRPFDGPVARVGGTLDIARLEAMGARMRALTGSGTTSFAVTLEPRVDVAGYAGSSLVNDAFVPRLQFSLDSVALRLDSSAGGTSQLTPRLAGSVSISQPGRITAGPISLPVRDTRMFASAGLGVTLLLLVGALALSPAAGSRSEVARIAERYGNRIVRARTEIPEGRWVTDVADMEALVRLADHYDRVILQSDDGVTTAYVLDDGLTVYRYEARGELADRGHSAVVTPRTR